MKVFKVVYGFSYSTFMMHKCQKRVALNEEVLL